LGVVGCVGVVTGSDAFGSAVRATCSFEGLSNNISIVC
jgi:hypothetical protein